MKIVDKRKRVPPFTLDDAEVGSVVRLHSTGKLYLVAEHSKRIEGSYGYMRTRILVNLSTGRSWTITNGDRSPCTVVDATLEIE